MTLQDAECLFTRNKLLEGIPKSRSTPYLILKYGPTGSGKGSSAVKKEIEFLGHDIEDYVVLEIDLLVEAIREYRDKTVELKSKRNTNNTYSNEKFFGNLYKAYANTRTDTLNNYLFTVFEKAVENKQNIIYETTGTVSNIKRLVDHAKKNDYKIVVIYPLVSEQELKKRVKERADRRFAEEEVKLYRHPNPYGLGKGIETAQSVLQSTIMPYLYEKTIHKLVMFWNE